MVERIWFRRSSWWNQESDSDKSRGNPDVISFYKLGSTWVYYLRCGSWPWYALALYMMLSLRIRLVGDKTTCLSLVSSSAMFTSDSSSSCSSFNFGSEEIFVLSSRVFSWLVSWVCPFASITSRSWVSSLGMGDMINEKYWQCVRLGRWVNAYFKWNPRDFRLLLPFSGKCMITQSRIFTVIAPTVIFFHHQRHTLESATLRLANIMSQVESPG